MLIGALFYCHTSLKAQTGIYFHFCYYLLFTTLVSFEVKENYLPKRRYFYTLYHFLVNYYFCWYLILLNSEALF